MMSDDLMNRSRKRPTDPLLMELRARRIALGLTQEKLAERVGVIEHTIRNGETGRSSPSLWVLRCWTQALGLTFGVNE